MKTSKLTRLAWVFFALTLASTTVFAQARGSRNRVSVDPPTMSCIDQISGLNDQQISKISSLEEQHQSVMAKLRDERRSTTNLNVKEQIRKQMDESVSNHQNTVRSLLNDDQKVQYNQIQAGGNLHKYQNLNGRGRNNNQSSVSGNRQGNRNGNFGNRHGKGSNRGRGRF